MALSTLALVVGATATGVTSLAAGVAVVSMVAGGDRPDPPSSNGVVVTRVIDGDTVRIAAGDRVRLIGIDTPERGKCGAVRATDALRTMVEGRTVTLSNPRSVQDRDTYGRLLRYVDVGKRDAGYVLLKAGLADARYDSQDGYAPHPRQARYRAAESVAVSGCDKAEQRQQRSDRWEEAERAAKRAGIVRARRETAGHLLRRATATLREQQRLRDQRRNRPAPAPDPPRSGSSGGLRYSTGNDHGYTGPRCYEPGGYYFRPC